MNRDALLDLRAVMARIDPERLNIDYFYLNPDDDAHATREDEAVACGTVACVAGWWALSPEGRARGWLRSSHWHAPSYFNDDGDLVTSDVGFAETFDLPLTLAYNLVYGITLYERAAHAIGVSITTITPRVVVAAIDMILDGHVSVDGDAV